MLIIDKNSVYEIDEECLKRKKVPEECGTVELLEELRKKNIKKLRISNKKSIENEEKYDRIE